MIKRILTGLILISALAIFATQSYAQESEGNYIQQRPQDQVKDPEGPATRTRDQYEDPGDSEVLNMDATEESETMGQKGNGSGSSVGAQYLKSIEQVMNQIRETVQTNNPEEGQMITQMIQSQIQIRNTIEAKLSDIEEKPAFLKFFFGPNYKNAGEVNQQIDALKLQLVQMTQLREQLRSQLSTGGVEVINDGIESIESAITLLESDLEQSLKGFSLFGWLNKILTGYSG
jgi:hypothetical protein